jgi:hypothetical protein
VILALPAAAASLVGLRQSVEMLRTASVVSSRPARRFDALPVSEYGRSRAAIVAAFKLFTARRARLGEMRAMSRLGRSRRCDSRPRLWNRFHRTKIEKSFSGLPTASIVTTCLICPA